MSNLFEELYAAIPTKREVHPNGWPSSVWVHRLDIAELVKFAGIDVSDESNQTDFLVELVVKCIGDEDGPRDFDTPRAKQWLRKQSAALKELGEAAMEVNEFSGSNVDRKKG